MKPKIIAVVGPTASGKSRLAVELATAISCGAEIISADSMQIYRGMDIGSAKPTAAEMRGIRHHLIDVADIGEPFSSADFASLASRAAADIASRGKVPILAGGTGFYIDHFLSGTDFGANPGDEKLRAQLEEEYGRLGAAALYERLSLHDPETAARLHVNDRKRVIRALEIHMATGIPQSEWIRRSQPAGKPYEALYIGIRYADRARLYARINRRVDEMLDHGLEEEVRRLYGEGLADSPTAGQAIGYKEMTGYIRGEMTFFEAADRIKQATRNYAKRQMTWFGRNKDIHWFEIGVSEDETDAFERVVSDANDCARYFVSC